MPCKRIRFIPYETPVDSFGRYRIYTSKPLSIPDSNCDMGDFCDRNFSPEPVDQSLSNLSLREAITPCPNLSTFYLLYWFWKGANKSKASRDDLLRNVILQPAFKPHDLDGMNLDMIDKKLAEAAYSQLENPIFSKSDGWFERTISIQVPILGKGKGLRATSHQYVSVPGTTNI
jgi:hypothetical protein